MSSSARRFRGFGREDGVPVTMSVALLDSPSSSGVMSKRSGVASEGSRKRKFLEPTNARRLDLGSIFGGFDWPCKRIQTGAPNSRSGTICPVPNVCGVSDCLFPKEDWKISSNTHCSSKFFECAIHSLGDTVLRGGSFTNSRPRSIFMALGILP